jgi:hypothetical protein
MQDERYLAIRTLIVTNQIKRIEQCFPIVSKTVIAKDAKINPGRFNTCISDVGQFSIAEMFALSKLFGIDYEVMHKFIFQEFEELIAKNAVEVKLKPRRKKKKTA